MESNPKKSKALIITIIILILLLIVGYLIFRNVGKSSSTNFISRIFSSLSPSSNTKKETVQAGEDISKGDNVSQAGTANNGNPVVVKARNGSAVLGVANEDIGNGDFGEIIVSGSGNNSFINSFSGFLDDLFGGDIGGGGFGSGGTGNDITITTECSDEIDNDGDGKIDIDDPECHLDGNLENEYLPNHDSEAEAEVPGGGISITTECSDEIDNDGDGKIDIDDPECHLDGNLENEYLPNHDSEAEAEVPGGNDLTPPDLTASAITPTNTTTNTVTDINTSISNNGESSTGASFYSFFTITNITRNDTQINTNNANVSKSKFKIFISKIIKKIPWVSSQKTIAEESVEVNTIVSLLPGKSSTNAKISYTFNSAGAYYIRACADKSGANDTGAITESNEENNCGPWTTVTVSDTLPTGGDTTYGEITVDDDDNQTTTNGEENKCLLIEQNPLEFTDAEKARLAILLRKFYLVSSTLRTEDDIVTIYNEIDQQKNLMSQTNDLTKQCYLQTGDQDGFVDFCGRNPKLCDGSNRTEYLNEYLREANTSYKYHTAYFAKHGNPWFTKKSGGTFPYTNGDSGYTNLHWLEGNYTCDDNNNCTSLIKTLNPGTDRQRTIGPGCKVVSGYYYGTTQAGVDCNVYNTFSDYDNCYQVYTNITNGDEGPEEDKLRQGCKWKEGVYLENTERILNIW